MEIDFSVTLNYPKHLKQMKYSRTIEENLALLSGLSDYISEKVLTTGIIIICQRNVFLMKTAFNSSELLEKEITKE